MAYKHRKYPEWSWSLSRDKTFNTCLRKYYYQYYKSHNGWEWDAPKENKKTYRLKKLKSLDTILGNVVHHLIYKLLEEKLPLKKNILDERIKKSLNEAFRSSKNKPAWEVNPSKHIMLKELYYDDKLSERKIDTINYKKKQIINYLVNSDLIEKIKKYYLVKSFDTDTFESFEFENTKVYAIPDLICKKEKDGLPNIIDWKTGKEKNSNIEQLRLYAYYYYNKTNYQSKIKTYFIYLYEQKIQEHIFDYDIIGKVEKEITKSIKKMKDYLEDKKWNKPLPENSFTKRRDDIVCSYCKYRELCNR